MKKKIILGAASVASIIAPVAAVVACGSDSHHSLDYDPSKPLVGNATGEDFFKSKDVYKDTFNSNLSKYDKQVSFALYDQEVEAAYNLQLGDFEFKKFKKEQSKTKAEKKKKDLEDRHKKEPDNEKKKALQTQIDAKAKEIKDLTTDIDKFDQNIKTANHRNVKFDSYSFGSDFPLLLKPFKNIKDAKRKYFKDQKAQFFKTFGPNQGAKKWPEEMRKKFGGSENEEDAIIWLASNVIQNVAKGAFTFKINDQYTVEQYIWAVLTNNQHWTFLSSDKKHATLIHINSDDASKIDDELKKHKISDVDWDSIDSIKDKKVYFISSNSKKVFPLDQKTESDFIEKIHKSTSLIKVQNGIIPFVRQDNPHKAWVIKDDELKKLLYFYGNKPVEGRRGISFFFDSGLYGIDKDDKYLTTMTLHLGKADSTSDKQGSLGFKDTLKYVRTMKPGFGLGILKLKGLDKKITNLPKEKSVSFTKLSKNINSEITSLFNKYHITIPTTSTVTEKNLLIDKLFEAGKKEISASLGGVIRDYFETVDNPNPNKTKIGGSLSYSIDGTSNHIVLSSFGIHVIHITGIDLKTDLSDFKKDIKDDLDEMAKEQNTNSSTGVVSLFNTTFSNQYNYYTEVIKNTPDLNKKLDEYNKNIKDDKDKLSILKLTGLIKRIHTSTTTSKVVSSLVNGITWYKKQLDNKLKNPALTVNKIYEVAKAVA